MPEVAVAVLGPLRVDVDGVETPIASSKQAALVGCLAVEVGHAIAPERLVELLWGEEPTERAEHALQQHVSSLRKLLEPDRAPRQEPTVLVTRRHGYELVARVDLADFEQAAADASAAAERADHEAAGRAIEQALSCWRGPALADLRGTTWADAVAARLDERRLGLLELRNDLLADQGRHDEVVVQADALLAQHPFRERSWAQLMTALYRCGRQADALAAFSRAREALVEQLGLEPGPELRELEQRILDQDPLLLSPVRPQLADHGHVAETFRPGQVGVPVVQLPDGQQVRLLDGENLIGRVPEAAIRLSDSRVSRRHAAIDWRRPSATLTDLDSTNGTAIDGVPVRGESVLADGSTISLGGVELVFRLSG